MDRLYEKIGENPCEILGMFAGNFDKIEGN